MGVAVIAVALLGSVFLAWRADQRMRNVERELVKRQHDADTRIAEAAVLARQAQDSVRDAAAKVALLQARVDEVAVQRGQFEELIQSLARSRDENVAVDIDAAVRVALQQSALTGSLEPLVATLRQSDERLARINQPRLDPVRRAIARDLERVRGVSLADVPSLVAKLDEVTRLVDDLPLLSASARAEPARRATAVAAPASAASAPAWFGARQVDAVWSFVVDHIWNEAKSLVRVTRIERPEGMLVAPDQSFFLRENLKLRLLNARLALLSRQFDTAQGDLQTVRGALDRYFDRSARRTQHAADLLQQVAQHARQVNLPRPDETLAALATAGVR
ncbi:uroporphyrinogen-III C-methyltransferase [Schlegelella sp. ID0723]|uniref:Uroporphyrinogen-III C-methyltransferase n=1 Tax=Piscinibacter koreensis TaxID=2742824 RepID=A0A7Y6NMS8_9BURK|nr:uroporphyrinogen-III C-methyltransferase [Schlegelella koreensis]